MPKSKFDINKDYYTKHRETILPQMRERNRNKYNNDIEYRERVKEIKRERYNSPEEKQRKKTYYLNKKQILINNETNDDTIIEI